MGDYLSVPEPICKRCGKDLDHHVQAGVAIIARLRDSLVEPLSPDVQKLDATLQSMEKVLSRARKDGASTEDVCNAVCDLNNTLTIGLVRNQTASIQS